MFGSSACCSKNIHCNASARSIRDFRRKRSAAGHVPENGVGFGEIAAFRDFQQRHLSAGILRQEVRRPAFAAEDVDLDGTIGRVDSASARRTL